jgi:ribonuclease P protein component
MNGFSILAFRCPPEGGNFSSFDWISREADLPAQRPTAEAQARFPRAHGDTRRPRDPEAPPSQGPRTALRVGAAPVKRANRLSRSRDFDAVYRHGRSASTRFLVLYWFPQAEPTEPRFGFSVPRAVGNAVGRNKIKRQLRDVWRARLDVVPPGHDYVLIVRPGLPEAAETNGFAWLGERVDEVLGKAAA